MSAAHQAAMILCVTCTWASRLRAMGLPLWEAGKGGSEREKGRGTEERSLGFVGLMKRDRPQLRLPGTAPIYTQKNGLTLPRITSRGGSGGGDVLG